MATYQEKSTELLKVTNVALETIQKFPPFGDEASKSLYIDFYEEARQQLLNPQPQYKNLTSLKYMEEDVFTYFQEGTGITVDYFLQRIAEEGLPFKRKPNRLQKILERGKINDQQEYHYIVDILVVAQQEGSITAEQAEQLSSMLGDFEARKKKK